MLVACGSALRAHQQRSWTTGRGGSDDGGGAGLHYSRNLLDGLLDCPRLTLAVRSDDDQPRRRARHHAGDGTGLANAGTAKGVNAPKPRPTASSGVMATDAYARVVNVSIGARGIAELISRALQRTQGVSTLTAGP